jgi:hypothetical protein
MGTTDESKITKEIKDKNTDMGLTGEMPFKVSHPTSQHPFTYDVIVLHLFDQLGYTGSIGILMLTGTLHKVVVFLTCVPLALATT